MRFAHALLTDVGRVRQRNEDLAAADAKRGLFILADGMGGHPAGNIASKTAVEAAMKYLTAKKVPGRPRDRAAKLRAAVHEANRAVLALSETDPTIAGMGTTICLLWLSQKRGTIAHVGDSRIYALREGELVQLTRDHTVVQELVDRGELDGDSIEAQRMGHILTQAVGLEPVVEPDLATFAPQPNDVYVLCSDGLSDIVDDPLIADIIERSEHDLERAARLLVEAALQAGGPDNITVLLVRVPAPPAAAAAPPAAGSDAAPGS